MFTCDTSGISDTHTVTVKLNQSGSSEVIESAVEIEDVRHEPDGVLGHFFPISPSSLAAQTLSLSLPAFLLILERLCLVSSVTSKAEKHK